VCEVTDAKRGSSGLPFLARGDFVVLRNRREGLDMSHLTVEVLEVAGGSLRIQLTTDHALARPERASFEQIVDACVDYAQHHPSELRDEFDVAIAELGGEENICAG
jgi:hypothetical protein